MFTILYKCYCPTENSTKPNSKIWLFKKVFLCGREKDTDLIWLATFSAGYSRPVGMSVSLCLCSHIYLWKVREMSSSFTSKRVFRFWFQLMWEEGSVGENQMRERVTQAWLYGWEDTQNIQTSPGRYLNLTHHVYFMIWVQFTHYTGSCRVNAFD